MVEGGGGETDWAGVLAMTEDELEAAIAADPDRAELPATGTRTPGTAMPPGSAGG